MAQAKDLAVFFRGLDATGFAQVLDAVVFAQVLGAAQVFGAAQAEATERGWLGAVVLLGQAQAVVEAAVGYTGFPPPLSIGPLGEES